MEDSLFVEQPVGFAQQSNLRPRQPVANKTSNIHLPPLLNLLVFSDQEAQAHEASGVYLTPASTVARSANTSESRPLRSVIFRTCVRSWIQAS